MTATGTRAPDVVLVEDDPHDLELIHAALGKVRPQPVVRAFRSGAHAVDFLTQMAQRPSESMPRFVLLDLKLPGMRGLEVLRALRADPTTALVPIVVFTSSTELSDVQDAYGAGATSYTVKPVSFETLRARVTAIAEYWLHLNEAPGSGEANG